MHQSLPIYSGGLGALAGDVLKEASDWALPIVAVGLLYRQGYFRQRLEVSGWQQEFWIDIDAERLPAALVRAPDGRPLTVTVPIRGSEVTAQIWWVAVGRVPLFLLDTDRPENGQLGRWITSQLYVADPITRLSQYALLGLGGVRALTALGIDPVVVHLNEGHAAFAALELARAEMAHGTPVEAALEAARQRTVFTTHTPVAAGNETYSREDIISTLEGVITELGVDPDVILRLGRNRADDTAEPFGVTQFSLRMSRAANAVSRRHGGIAREMWRGLFPRHGRRGSANYARHERRASGELDRAVDATRARPSPRRGVVARGERRRDLGGAGLGARHRALERPMRTARRAGGVRQGTQRDRSTGRASAAGGNRGGRPRV